MQPLVVIGRIYTRNGKKTGVELFIAFSVGLFCSINLFNWSDKNGYFALCRCWQKRAAENVHFQTTLCIKYRNKIRVLEPCVCFFFPVHCRFAFHKNFMKRKVCKHLICFENENRFITHVQPCFTNCCRKFLCKIYSFFTFFFFCSLLCSACAHIIGLIIQWEMIRVPYVWNIFYMQCRINLQ